MDAFNIVTRAYNSNALPKIKRLLRVTEILLVLVFLTYATAQLPLAVKVTGEHLRHLVIVALSPFFIFLLGNVIVLTLIFKSHHDFFPQQEEYHQDQNSQISTDTLFDFRQEPLSDIDETPSGQSSENNVVFQDKETIIEVVDDTNCGTCCEMQLNQLEAETRQRVAEATVDQLSSEEFKREIEAFIARQIKLHKQEKLAIVLHHARI